jgi:hypothetical protein
MALRKSDGSLWIAPPAIALAVMRQLQRISFRPTSRFSGPATKNGSLHFIPHGPLQPVVRRHSRLTP